MLRPDDFAGLWQVTREIDDRYSGQIGRFEGEVRFGGDRADTLHYNESGTMRFGDGPDLQATRSYFWHFHADHVDVTFADRKPFHRFRAEGQGLGTDHPCGDDLYTVRYDFTGWPRWTAVWTVKGPRKDYVSTSLYTPVQSQS